MKQRVPEHRAVFQSSIRAKTKTSAGARRSQPLAAVCLALLTFAGMCLMAGALSHEWGRMSGSSAASLSNWWPAQSVLAQGGAGTFTIIDAPGAGTSMLQGTTGIGINAGGEIVGIYTTAPNVAHGFVRGANGTIATFDAPNAGTALTQGTFAVAIDAGGDVAGMYADASSAYHGFVRAAGGTTTEFDVPGAPTTTKHRGTIPMCIDTGGDIAGFYVDSSAVRHGFVRAAGGTVTTFDPTGAGTVSPEGTVPLGINAGGDITGYYIDANKVFHGFLRAADGTITAPIDAPGASTTSSKGGFSFSGTLADGIDTAGDITGIYTDVNGVHHGFIRAAGGTFTAPIDATGAGAAGSFKGTLPAGINTGGAITGVYEDANGLDHGFIRSAGGTFTAPLDAPGASTTSIGFLPGGTVSVGINDSGATTGGFFDTNGVGHGFLFTPASTLPQAAAPTFSPPADTYTSAQMVSLADTTPGATIMYSTDGSAPSIHYTGAISVTTTETIMAVAAATGFSNSAVSSALYTINLPTPDFTVSVNPTSLTIVAGQSGMATFTVTPENGFDSQVSFGCSGLPPGVKCGFNPPNVTPTGGSASTRLTSPRSAGANGGSASTTLTVSTTAPGAAVRASMPSTQHPINGLLLVVLGMMLALAAGWKRAHRGLQFLGLLILLTAAAGLSSCNGGGGGGNTGTPTGSTSISVSASTSGSGINHGAALTIIITQ